MKRKVLYIVCVLFIVLLVTGCGETAKEKAQSRILTELRTCEYKFGSNDNEARTLKNSEYCSEMRQLVEKLIYDGWFDEVGDTKLQKATIQKNIEEIKIEDTTVDDEVNKFKQSIVGTI